MFIFLFCGITLLIFIAAMLNIVLIQKAYLLGRQQNPLIVYKRSHVVCVVARARMGNNMFQFAAALGIARSKGMIPVINEYFPLRKIFKLTVSVVPVNSDICDSSRIVTRVEQKPSSYDLELVNFTNAHDVRLVSYLGSYMYFDKYSSELRKQFLFQDNIQSEANKTMEGILNRLKIISRQQVTLIGVHVRRGDYVKNNEGYLPATREYLYQAVEWYELRYTHVYFIVASDGIDWTKNNMPTHIKVAYLEGHSPAVDMATVSMCDHFISTVGTFSWWCGWLTGGNVLYYKWPCKEGSLVRAMYSSNYSDFYYPHWIGL